MANTQFFIGYLEHFSYFGIFIIFTFAGYLIPLPEEIFLLLVGYIAGTGFYNIYLAILFAISGILVGDNTIFWLSRYKATKIVGKIKSKLKKSSLVKLRKLMKKRMGLAIFASRFILGLRFFSPFLAGSMKIKWRTFQFYNLLAILIYVPTLTLFGFFFHNQIASIITKIQFVRHVLFLLMLALAGFLLIFFASRYLDSNNKD